ncbi:SUPPRESSOR OF GAMMA RESPONSE 1-like, partial [Hibiscus syriacus]
MEFNKKYPIICSRRSIAKTIKNAIRICEANRECPNCHRLILNSDPSPQWSNLPIGVKFDPSDAELLKHLAAKCGVGGSTAHPFIDDFIPTLEEDQGICYTHPENLPGAKKDGSSIHFFHRTINAYGTGRRKRRRIQSQYSITEEYRWHKTGKTKPVIENGVHRGWKKIMVLYKRSKRVRKPEKSNWVMHQYHLGAEEEEHDGEYVVSRISYRHPKQTKMSDDRISIEEPADNSRIRACTPTTPKTITTNRSWPGGLRMYEDDIDEDMHQVQAAANSEMNRSDNSVRAPGTTEASTGNNNTCTCGISELEDLEFSSLENIFS